MAIDHTCTNCSSFIQGPDDPMSDLGICLMDDVFEPFMDELLEDADFSGCGELYKNKCFSGEREACNEYNEVEYLEILEELEEQGFSSDEINACLNYMNKKYDNVDEVIKYFYDTNSTVVNNAISYISQYIYLGNESAYEGLLKYYFSLGSAETLEDVSLRMKIIELLLSYRLDSSEVKMNIIAAFVNELERTPSNNTTRKLYTKILDQLRRYPYDMIVGPLEDLLGKKKYASKIKNRILDTITASETDEYRKIFLIKE